MKLSNYHHVATVDWSDSQPDQELANKSSNNNPECSVYKQSLSDTAPQPLKTNVPPTVTPECQVCKLMALYLAKQETLLCMFR